MKRLNFIRRSRELGFSIEQIKELLAFIDEPNHYCGEVKAMALQQAREVQQKIEGLERLKEALNSMVTQRTNLMMAQRGTKWLDPVLFTGSCTAPLMEKWLESCLFKELKTSSLIILDNAPFHRKKYLHEIAEKHGHKILFLSPYSPDFNPIEQSFGLIKRKRLYDKKNMTIEEIRLSYF